MRCAHRAAGAILLTQRRTASTQPNPIENQRRNSSARTSERKKLFLTDQHHLFNSVSPFKNARGEEWKGYFLAW